MRLPTRTLGKTGLEVTTLGYGAMELRGAPQSQPITPEHAGAILNSALDSGINYIDTSRDYGKCEEFIGQYISHRRSEFYLATKCGCVLDVSPHPGPGVPFPHLYTPENIIRGVNDSLTRMKTDYIDVLQFHGDPSKELLEEQGAIEAILDIKKAGKARFIGISSTLPRIGALIELGVFDVFQIPYSILDRDHESAIEQAIEAGAGTIIRGGAAKGALEGRREGGAALDLWNQAQLDDLLDDMTRVEFMLRFNTGQSNLHTTIVATTNLEHMQNNVNAGAKGSLAADVITEAKRRLDAASGA